MPAIQHIKCFPNKDGLLEFRAVLYTVFSRRPSENRFLYEAVMEEARAVLQFGISPDLDASGEFWAYQIEGVLNPVTDLNDQAEALVKLAITLTDISVLHQYAPDLSALHVRPVVGRRRHGTRATPTRH